MTSNDDTTLYALGDRGQTIDGSANDVRGREVKDADGAGIGTIDDLLIDGPESKVRFLLVEHGGILGFGQSKTMIPVDAVTNVTEDAVFVDLSKDRVASAPGYAPDLVHDRTYHASIYNHFGYEPYWGAGYLYPVGLGMGLGPFPMAGR
ncbi:hypothetical protein BA895_12080 [Humibacillus sp. DSM 29435]|uniref:PRC-barrel domain-containing protein n=1 Tax=Humibacillus sp. DSM 29435 TaxID=1869167 RepID=UPI000871CBED|nr:PRC-barrel domain-containing protein [Humibacillus sp. DSM 29435]OFE18366.1 hypothetical protein BA895_12080 [Humibacillus sp. DSM 29435]